MEIKSKVFVIYNFIKYIILKMEMEMELFFITILEEYSCFSFKILHELAVSSYIRHVKCSNDEKIKIKI